MENHSVSRIPYWKQIIMILTAGWIIIWIYRMALTPIYPIISDFFGGASDAQLGNISSFYFLGYVLMQIPSGVIVDKLGKKKVIIPGFLAFAIGSLIVATSTSLSALYTGSVLAGLGCGTFYGVAYSLTTEYVPAEKRSVATAIVNSGTAIGSGLGLVSASYFVGKGILPWQSLIWITFGLILVLVLVFFKFLRKDIIVPQQSTETAHNSDKFTISQLFKPQMVAAYLLYFSTLYTYYLIDTWLPNFLETEKGFEGTAVGIASSLVFFVAIPGALFFSSLADKLPTKKIPLIIGLEILAAMAVLFTINVSSQTAVVVGIIAYGFFGKLAVEPIIIAWLSQFTNKKSVATTYGVFNFFGMTASVIVPSLTGFISDVTGSKIYAFYLAAAIIFIGTFCFFIINKIAENKAKAANTLATVI